MTEQLANNAQTTLNGAIDDNDTTLVVTSATGFPTVGNFRILIAAEGGNTDEICTVTAVSGTTFTITRASEATAGVQTASSHGNGAIIAHVLTAGALNALSLPAGFIGCKATWSSGSIPSGGGYKPVPFNGTEIFDTDNFHSTSSNNSRITIPPGLGGPYLIIGAYYSSTAETNYGIIMKNGSPAHSDYGVSGDDTILTVTTPLILAAGDYVELGINATTLNTISAASLTVLKLDSGRVGSLVGASAKASATQAISAFTFTPINLDGTDDFDTNNFHDPSTNNSRFTIPTGLDGKYFVIVGPYFASGGNPTIAAVAKNGTILAPDSRHFSVGAGTHEASFIVDVVSGDYIEGYVYANSAQNLNTGNGSEKSYVRIMRLDSGGSNYTGPLWGAGTAFPSGPATNQRFTRTDYGLDFYYDGTRWLTTQLFKAFGNTGDNVCPLVGAASGAITRHPLINTPALDLWMVSFDCTTYTGSPSSGSHYRTLDLAVYNAANSSTILGSFNTSSDTADTWVAHSVSINTAVSISTYKELQVNVTRTGTPGDLYFGIGYSYRLIGT